MTIDVGISRSFRVVDACSPADRTREMLTSRAASLRYIVVERRLTDGERLHYVFSHDELYGLLKSATTMTLMRVLKLHSRDCAPSVQADESTSGFARHGVLLRGRRVVGLIEPASATRAGTISTAATAEKTPGNHRAGTALPEVVKRHLAASSPALAVTGDTIDLLVSLKAHALPGTAGAEVNAAIGTRLNIVVKAGEGLSVVGYDSGELVVAEPQPDTPLLFHLKVGEAGTGRVTVYAFSNGISLAALTLTTRIELTRAGTKPSANVDVVRPVELSSGTRPDLSLYIFEHGNELTFQLQSADGRLNMQRYGPTVLSSDTRAYFRTFFGDIENLSGENDDERRTIARQLSAKGANLFNTLFPEALRTDLWERRDEIKTVQITSEEPWIPWELCRLIGKDGARTVEGPFLADFCLTRWLFGVSAARMLPMKKIALVVPADSGLASAPDEKAYVLSLAGKARQVVEIAPTYLGVTDAMIEGTADAWHFIGHASADPGVDADRSPIELENRRTLTPVDISGSVENLFAARPFVFLNACQSGVGGVSLTGMGGWAERLLKPGAREATAAGFIGSLWSIDDRSAFDFAKAFYERMLAGSTVGMAARDARRAIKRDGDTTWLAYTVYADPGATITSASSA